MPTLRLSPALLTLAFTALNALPNAHAAVLLVSNYLPELLGVCDWIAVMSRGRLGAARPACTWTEHSLLMEASGARAS